MSLSGADLGSASSRSLHNNYKRCVLTVHKKSSCEVHVFEGGCVVPPETHGVPSNYLGMSLSGAYLGSASSRALHNNRERCALIVYKKSSREVHVFEGGRASYRILLRFIRGHPSTRIQRLR